LKQCWQSGHAAGVGLDYASFHVQKQGIIMSPSVSLSETRWSAGGDGCWLYGCRSRFLFVVLDAAMVPQMMTMQAVSKLQACISGWLRFDSQAILIRASFSTLIVCTLPHHQLSGLAAASSF